MEYLAVTAVEDSLQDDVAKTLLNLRKGGIQIWMLTGDKVETAKCIAITTGLKKDKRKFFQIVQEKVVKREK